MVSALIVGCAAQPSFGAVPLSNIEGRWFWEQDPWYGYFVLK